jgi:hypothetical protein
MRSQRRNFLIGRGWTAMLSTDYCFLIPRYYEAQVRFVHNFELSARAGI